MNSGQNKLLIGFGVVMLAGVGASGFLLWQAGSRYSDLHEEYTSQITRLKALQSQPLYPEQSNLDKMEQQKQEAAKAAAEFKAELTPMAFPLEPISPELFQDKLRATVSDVVKKAAAAKVKLPETRFYLGFNDYQTKPPTVEAAPALYRELKAVELATNLLIESKILGITSIKRDPLPEEADASKMPGVSAPVHPTGTKPSGLYSEFPFEIKFSTDQVPFRRAINALASNRTQVFVVTSMLVKNSGDKPIPREASTTAPVAEPTPVATPTPTPPPGVMATAASAAAAAANGQPAENLKFLVGTENLNVTLRLDMIVFAGAAEK